MQRRHISRLAAVIAGAIGGVLTFPLDLDAKQKGQLVIVAGCAGGLIASLVLVFIPLGIHDASAKGKLVRIRALLARGTDVNTPDRVGATPLIHAALHGRLEAVKILVEAGASIEAASSGGTTALHAAAQAGHVEVVRYLVKQGADVTAPDKDGETPSQLAAARRHTRVVAFLQQLDTTPETHLQLILAELQSPDANVREQAVTKLGEMGAEASMALEALEAVSRDESRRVRARAAWAVGIIRRSKNV